jgi:hypothetical protein
MAGAKSAITSAPTSEPRLRASALAAIRLSHVWATTAVVVPVLVLAGSPLAMVDLAYQLRAGDIMLDTHAILRTDVFAATAYGRPWLNQQWLAQILLAAAFRLGGWFAMVALRALLMALVLAFVFLACRAAGAATKRAAWLTMASGVLLTGAFKLRPQLFGMVCFAATAWLVARRRTHPEGVWIVIPITVLWANLHGSFFLAPLMLGLAWIEDRSVRGRGSRTVLLAGLGSLLATLVNPYGHLVWSYAAGLATNPVIRATITEWRPPTIQSYTGAAFFVSVVVVAALLIGRVRRPVPWGSLLPLVVFLAIALAAIRGVWWWTMIAPIVLAGVLSDRPARLEQRDHAGAVNAAIVGVLAASVIGVMIRWAPYTGPAMPVGDKLSFAPVGITRELHGILRPGELVFNAQQWGSWLELEFPRNPVIVDSLIEVIPPSVWWKYDAVSNGVQGWQATLDAWDVDVAVLARDQQAQLIPKMKTDPRWAMVYEDAEGLIFTRVSSTTGAAGPTVGAAEPAVGALLRSSR